MPRFDAMLIALILAVLAFIWRIQDLFPVLGALELPSISVGLALLATILGKRRGRSRRGLRHPIARWAWVLLGLMLLSVPFSLYPGLSLRFILNDHLKTLLLFALVIYSIRSHADVERFAIAQVIGATIYSVVVRLRFTVQPGGRLGHLYYYDANDIALLLTATIPMCVYLLRPAAKRWHKGLAGVGLFFSLLTVVQSGSRGGFLALLAVGAYLLIAYRAIPKATRFLALVGLSSLLVFTASDAYWELMRSMLNPTEDYNYTSETGRKAIWTRGLGYMAQHPLTGVGVRAFPVAEGHLSDRGQLQEFGIGFKWSTAHNSFLQIGAEVGIPGLLAFLALLFTGARYAHRAGGRAPPGVDNHEKALGQALVGALIAFAVAGFFLSQAYSAFLYSILAMIAGLAVTSSAGAVPAGARRVGPAVVAAGPGHRPPPRVRAPSRADARARRSVATRRRTPTRP
jgi:O-antigen ligase